MPLLSSSSCDAPKAAWFSDVALRHDGSAVVVGAYGTAGSPPTASLGTFVLPAHPKGAVFSAQISETGPSDVRVFPVDAAMGPPVGVAVDGADDVWIAGVAEASGYIAKLAP